jgi:hypothetical protein
MEDFTKPARERFLERLHTREDFIGIPLRGTKILSFTNQLNSDTGVLINVEVDDTGRKTYKLNDRRNKKRRFKIPYTRVDIGAHPDVKGGVIIRDVEDSYVPTLEDTVSFVNLYLGYNISVEEVNERFFDAKNKLLTIRIRKNCLRYIGQVRVNLI